MTLPYRLTREADADIESIIRYAVEDWGEKQSEHYVGLLENCFRKIATIKAPRPFSKPYPELFVTRCERHYIFYLRTGKSKPVIIAVLHGSMDMISHIQHRLEN